jgi:hypothetical protein
MQGHRYQGTVIIIRSHFCSVVLVATSCSRLVALQTFRGFGLSAASGSMPSWWRFVAGEYDGVEHQEIMTDRGVVLCPEHGYLAVTRYEQVLVFEGSLTNGHGGNRFDFYVFAQNVAGHCGWIPDAFVALQDMGEEYHLDVHEVGHPDATLAEAVPNDIVADGEAEAPEDGWTSFFAS